MSDLDQDAAALLRAGRAAFRPGAWDPDRVLHALTAAFEDAFYTITFSWLVSIVC